MKWIAALAVPALLAFGLASLASRGHFGVRQGGGEVTAVRRAESTVEDRTQRQREAAARLEAPGEKQILFGDLHVHTTFSFDAFNLSLPMYQGEGSHPPADACDFARFCSGLDFWSINDHAEGLTPYQWSETRKMVRQCNEVAGDPQNPDLVTYLGWEWTQIGSTPENHFGHKNVVLKDTADEDVPRRPISSRRTLFTSGKGPFGPLMRLFYIASGGGGQGRQPYHDFARFLQDRSDLAPCESGVDVRDLPGNCQESAPTPTELFDKLDSWAFPYFVIPHGNTWGIYTPALSSWDKQLRAHRDPERHEPLIEVFSGHGSIEEYRSFRALERDEDGMLHCPEPSPGFTPECWRAGEIIRERCAAAGERAEECEARARQARIHHVEAGQYGFLTVPAASLEEWLDAGQCTDCYMPAYDHRPGGSVQYALALRDFEEPGAPKRFRFGMIGSSDIHTARPGTGYKESQRRKMTDAGLGLLGPPSVLRPGEPEPRSLPLEEAGIPAPYFERFASFFGAGGLVAAHSVGRDRDSIWQALERKEVYATSGERILLWFDLVDEDEPEARVPMGSSVERSKEPTFEVRAQGAFVQKPGCPADTLAAVPAERLDRLCGGECYHPSDERKPIDRIEVVRIRPQQFEGEPVEDLIEDPWRTLACPGDGGGCRARFSDPDFSGSGRDSVYYVRAVERASATINGDQLRCTEDESGACVEVAPCRASAPTAYDDDCLAMAEERAWSSPIFVDYRP
jgi:hypothetical protein